MDITRIVTMRQDETVSMVVRGFWLTQIGKYVVAFVLMGAPFFFMIPLFKWGWYGLAIFGVAVAAGLLVGLRAFFLWYWNCFIITSERVIDIDQRGFFDRVVSEAGFDKVQDVSYRVKGVFGTLLHFGIVVVQTAGSTTNLELAGIRNPQDVQHEIAVSMAAYLSSPERGPAKTEKGSDLIAAAAEMSDVEARAFVTELQEAMARQKAAAQVRPGEENLASINLPEDWRNEKDKKREDPSNWKRRRV